jgi:hypothetical protein
MDDNLLLRDYKPKINLSVTDNTPERAKFHAINAHVHFPKRIPTMSWNKYIRPPLTPARPGPEPLDLHSSPCPS